jgi:branched-chain amino acid transport system permease protein
VLSVIFGLALEWLLFRHFYQRDHLDQVLLTFGLIYIFEELRSILWGDDVHGVTIPDLLSASIPLTDNLSYPSTASSCRASASRWRWACTADLEDAPGHEDPRRRLQPRHGRGAGHQHQADPRRGVRAGRGPGRGRRHDRRAVASVYPNMGSQVLIMCFVVVVIGGIGSVRGALISALLVGLVDTFGKVLLPHRWRACWCIC